MNDEQWVEKRMRVLEPDGNWNPHAGAALAALRGKDRRRRNWRQGWAWSAAMGTLAVAVMVVLPAKCALAGVGCPRPAGAHVRLAPAAAIPKTPDYKETGAPDAPVLCEIYSDYECPSCARFYTEVYPRFEAEYVKTGKVKVVHRDLPLPQHPYARLAARYANAAGESGHYAEVFPQLFASQSEWAANGNVDAAVAKVVPPDTMRKIRALVENDAALDAELAGDLAMVAREHVDQTPTIVFAYRGTRRKVAGSPSFDVLRSFLEQLLAQR